MKKFIIFIVLLNIISISCSYGYDESIANLDIFKGKNIRIIKDDFSDTYKNTYIVQVLSNNEIYENYFVYANNLDDLKILKIPQSGGSELNEAEKALLENEYFKEGHLYYNIKVFDFNGNGKKDFLIYQSFGIGPYCQLFEFEEDQLNILLSFEPSWSYAYPFQYINLGVFRVFPSASDEIHQDGSPTLLPYIDYQWDSVKNSFQVIDEGSIDAHFDVSNRLFYPVDKVK